MPLRRPFVRWQAVAALAVVAAFPQLAPIVESAEAEAFPHVVGTRASSSNAGHGTERRSGTRASSPVTFRLRGRIDTDAIWSSQDAENVATFGSLGDAVGLRRVWIGAEGRLGTQARYVTEIDLASGNVVPRDVFVGFGEFPTTRETRVGHFLEPFSLEVGTSSNSFAFMERSPISMLDPARNWGLAQFQTTTGETSTFGLGLFRAGNDEGGLQGGDGATVGLTSRWTSAIVHDDNRVLHAAIALSERIPEYGVVIFNQRPSNPLLDLGDSATSPFVPTLRIPARFQQLVNLQLAWSEGPFWAQSEWYGTYLDQPDQPGVFLHGSYAACGWFLTGEHRAYLPANGVFGAVRVKDPVWPTCRAQSRSRGRGAWEVAARVGYLDFLDSDTPAGSSGQLVGIQLPTATWGINWYLSDQVRLLFNYTYQVPDEPNTGSSSAQLLAARLNVFW